MIMRSSIQIDNRTLLKCGLLFKVLCQKVLKDYLNIKLTIIRLSPSKKDCIICFIENPLKMMKNAFYFILKTLFVFTILTFSSWLFGYVGKIAWLETWSQLQNSWHQKLVNKHSQCTYCTISQEVKAISRWDLVNW